MENQCRGKPVSGLLDFQTLRTAQERKPCFIPEKVGADQTTVCSPFFVLEALVSFTKCSFLTCLLGSVQSVESETETWYKISITGNMVGRHCSSNGRILEI